jgi:hypothetical protein
LKNGFDFITGKGLTKPLTPAVQDFIDHGVKPALQQGAEAVRRVPQTLQDYLDQQRARTPSTSKVAPPFVPLAPQPSPNHGVVRPGAVTKQAPPDASNITQSNRGDAIVAANPFVLARTKGGDQAWIRSVDIEDANGRKLKVLQVCEADGKVTEFYGDAKSKATLQEQFGADYKVTNPVH